jgi:genome maintenance exonuclease 1
MFKYVDTHTLPELKVEHTATGKRFYVTPEGKKYPSITTILGAKEKPYLTKWRSMLGDKKADRETERCADRGTAVHSMCEKYLYNDENPTKGHDAKHIKCFNQLKFRLNNINNIRAQEVALYSDYLKVAGRLDVVAEYDKVPSIIDFKTSNNNKDVNMIDDYFKQGTFYSLAWEEITGELIENIVILMSVEKGMVPLVFKDKIENWISPLLYDINKFNNR